MLRRKSGPKTEEGAVDDEDYIKRSFIK